MIFIFPGQGSQIVGMGKDIYDNFSVARDVFHEVDEAIDRPLSKIIFEGPTEELRMTENAQPALMTVSIAILRTIEYLIGKSFYSLNHVKYLAGHSVGEYTSLCASKSISLHTTARLLSVRSCAMQAAFPKSEGGMLALLCFGSDEEVAKVIKYIKNDSNCEVSNDNGAGQIVVSGNNENLECLSNNLKNTIVKKIIRLNVSGPFHSSLMSSASLIMQEFLANVNLLPPILPIISNVSACEETDPQVLRALLVKQITHTVRWREVVQYAISKGCRNFIEIGSGDVLSKLVKRIDSTANTRSINSLPAIESIVTQLETFHNTLCPSN